MTSTYADMIASASEYLEVASTNHYPDLSSSYTTFSTLLNQKLYHQLAVKLLSFVSDSTNLRSTPEGTNSFLALFDSVVLAVEKKVNPLTLARIASNVSHSLLNTTLYSKDDKTATSDGEAAKALLENLLEKKDMLGIPATLYAEAKLHLLKLFLLEGNQITGSTTMNAISADTSNSTPSAHRTSSLESTRVMLERNTPILTELAQGTESDVAVVHAAHHECAMTYRKVVGPPEKFYKDAIQYLSYTPLDTLDGGTQHVLATDVSLAALTGAGVYNFGEVVHNNAALLASLENERGGESSWLVGLMKAAASGDVTAMETIWDAHSTQDSVAGRLLTQRIAVVREKITLLALVNMVFERASSDRTLKFDDIAKRTHVPIDDVEWVVMRALSLGLIGGTMDQVDATVDVHWVMPRVLDAAQMNDMATRFEDWAAKVTKTREFMSEHVPTFG